jgi:hypothetical protein
LAAVSALHANHRNSNLWRQPLELRFCHSDCLVDGDNARQVDDSRADNQEHVGRDHAVTIVDGRFSPKPAQRLQNLCDRRLPHATIGALDADYTSGIDGTNRRAASAEHSPPLFFDLALKFASST